jgi:hypothetical protein
MQAIAISLILTGSLAACCEGPQIVPVPQDLTGKKPPRPVLPRITAEEAQDIPTDTWEKITTRDRQRRQYAEDLEVIIDGTAQKEPKP